MKWRLVDRITSFSPWKRIEGRKAVSLEEYGLLERHGRKGVFPETLLLETCVQLSRWLVAKSSRYEKNVVLESVEEFKIERPVVMGETIDVRVAGHKPSGPTFEADCRVAASGVEISRGRLRLRLQPLENDFVSASMESLWSEIAKT